MSGFSSGDYEGILLHLMGVGYEVRHWESAELAKPHLILRHDVDMSPEIAALMGEAENHLGLSSTYFVLIRSPLYNALAQENVSAMRRLVSLGHRIGLHFDATLYDATPEAVDKAVCDECAILENICETPVDIVSFHRPVKSLLGYERTVGGRRHTYEPYFFSEMGYCSDSRGQWAHGHPLDHSSVREKKALQFLTHPIWWFGSEAEEAQLKLDDFVHRVEVQFRTNLAANCQVYKNPQAG